MLCAEVQVAKALLDNKSITRLTKWRYCPDDTDIASSDEARLILSYDKCKRVIGVDKLAAHVIINEESMAIYRVISMINATFSSEMKSQMKSYPHLYQLHGMNQFQRKNLLSFTSLRPILI